MTQVPNSKFYEKPLRLAGTVRSRKRGLIRPVEVVVVRGATVVAEGFVEGNLRERVRQRASKARRKVSVETNPCTATASGCARDRSQSRRLEDDGLWTRQPYRNWKWRWQVAGKPTCREGQWKH